MLILQLTANAKQVQATWLLLANVHMRTCNPHKPAYCQRLRLVVIEAILFLAGCESIDNNGLHVNVLMSLAWLSHAWTDIATGAVGARDSVVVTQMKSMPPAVQYNMIA